MSDGKLTNYWFATGTPTILTKLIKKFNMNPVELDKGMEATQDMFDAPTETAVDPMPMLYQSGYLTIKEFNGISYVLAFPNDEVRLGFLKALMPYYAMENPNDNDIFMLRFTRAMREGRLEDALQEMRAFMSGIPYNAERIDERHYTTIFGLIFRLCTQFDVRAEECSAAGRADAVVETADSVYVFEFKLAGRGTAETALKQIDDKGYLIPYSTQKAADGRPKKLFKVGVVIDKKKRTLGKWKWVVEK